MNTKFNNSEYIVLGLKDKKGKFYLYHSSLNKTAIIPIKMNESATSVLSVFPFSHFSSLDDDKTKGYHRVYLKVRLVDELSKEQIDGLDSSGLMYHRFSDKEMVLLEEFNTPFQYALEMLDTHEKLGTYGLTTWLIHEEPKSTLEFDSMTEILNIALSREEYKKHRFSLSLDKYVLRYVPSLMTHENNKQVAFGLYGYVNLTKDEIANAEQMGSIRAEELTFLIDKIGLDTALFAHSEFTTELLVDYMSISEYNAYNLISGLDSEDISEMNKVGINIDKIFEFQYKFHTVGKYHEYSDGEYVTVEELVSNTNYEPTTETSDPIGGYCCEDCDGYELDYLDYLDYQEYEVDDQTNILQEIIREWSDNLTEDSAHLFAGWSNDILNRYLIEYGENKFIGILINKSRTRIEC